MADDKKTYGLSADQLDELKTVFAPGTFAGQVALVSGAGSGLGRGIAWLIARLGASVVLCGRTEEKLRATADGIAKFGGEVEVVPVNIRDADAVSSLYDRVYERFGKLDILFNSAGGQFPQAALDFSVKGWNAVIDTNLNGTWYMMQQAARRWVEAGVPGNIVNIVTVVDRGMPGVAHSCAARAGVIYLSKTVAVEWAPHNIRVNCVAPGVIDTEGMNVYPEEALTEFPRQNPMLHLGNVQDVAEACCFLAAPSGKYITGETLSVDGGTRLWGEFWAAGMPDHFRP